MRLAGRGDRFVQRIPETPGAGTGISFRGGCHDAGLRLYNGGLPVMAARGLPVMAACGPPCRGSLGNQENELCGDRHSMLLGPLAAAFTAATE